MIAPTLARIFCELEVATGVQAQVAAVPNEHFGSRINVSGLLTARDFLAALRGRDLGDAVLLPRTSLDYFGRKFLDDGTPAELEAALRRPVLFASDMTEVVEQLASLTTGSAHREPALPTATNGIFWTTKD